MGVTDTSLLVSQSWVLVEPFLPMRDLKVEGARCRIHILSSSGRIWGLGTVLGKYGDLRQECVSTFPVCSDVGVFSLLWCVRSAQPVLWLFCVYLCIQGVHGRRTTQASPCYQLASLSICCILFDNRSYLLSHGKWVSALLFGGYIVSDFFETSWTAAHQVPLSFIISWSLLKFMSIGDAT